MCDTPGCIEQFGQRCLKKYSKWCLLLEEQGVPQQKLKRAFHIRKCGDCNIIGCPAHTTIIPNVGVFLGMDQLHELDK